MKYFGIVLVLFLAVGIGFAWQKESPEKETVTSPRSFSGINAETIQVGDYVNALRVVQVEPVNPTIDLPRSSNIKITFEGSVTLHGVLTVADGYEYEGTILEISKNGHLLPHQEPGWATKSICIANPEVRDPDVVYEDNVQVVLNTYTYVSYPAGGCTAQKVTRIKKI